MIELIKIIEPYLNSKGNYSTVRKAVGLLINLSISSFTFETFYGAYKWYDINDYKLILDFFIKGNFFVPFVIFIITSSSIILIANLLFYAANHFKTNKLIRKIISVEINHQQIEDTIIFMNKSITHTTPVVLTTEQLIAIYKDLKSKISDNQLFKIKKQIDISKRNVKDLYILLFQMGVATTIYFQTIPYFGIILFMISLVLIITMIYITILFYRLLDILPFLAGRINREAESYINDFKK
jgi:hypothetical protein